MRFQINQERLNLFQPSVAFHKPKNQFDSWKLLFVQNYCLSVLSGNGTKRLGVYIELKKTIGNTHLCPGTRAFVGAWA